jgi:hypothetical protein
MKNVEGKVAGVLGTVIIHLIAGILFMSFKIHSLNTEPTDMFIVEVAPAEEEKEENNLVTLPATTVERILQGDEEMLNIARNLANKPDINIDPEEYIDMVKEELIKNGQLSRDNYIDEQKRAADMNGDENLAMIDEAKPDDKPDKSEEMAANYQGPTRIYYDLAGRTHTYLPLPIYKCQSSGKVTLRIDVNQKGTVESAKIIENESTTNDLCLIEAAVRSALISRFNADAQSPKIQTGTLTYHFVAQ